VTIRPSTVIHTLQIRKGELVVEDIKIHNVNSNNFAFFNISKIVFLLNCLLNLLLAFLTLGQKIMWTYSTMFPNLHNWRTGRRFDKPDLERHLKLKKTEPLSVDQRSLRWM